MSIKKFQKELKAGEAFFISNSSNIHYFANFTGTNGQIFVTAKKAFLLTDFRYVRVAQKVLPKVISLIETKKSLAEELNKLIKKEKIQAVYFESTDLSHHRFEALKKNLNAKFLPKVMLPEKFRVIKTPEELKLLTKAQRIAEKVFIEVRKNLKPGKTEEQIAWEIEMLGHEFGADTISFPAIVGFGANSGSPHHQNSNKKLKKGDMVLIDMGMKYQGYCSDMTRMIFTKKPTDLEAKIYNIVLDAQLEAIKHLKAGVKGSTGDAWSRDLIKKAGYGDTFGHSLGHGIGLDVHELPYLSTGFDQPIPEGTVVTVEPGIYLENSFGVRIEDMVLVKRNNVVNLTNIPKRLKDCIFPLS
ncbi:aminopeptidase P family protein [Candidatus Peregrinibacteria bacterium]|nr:aminopeptidase P family protein [Candidatus Peregrinibacteria bacterium]